MCIAKQLSTMTHSLQYNARVTTLSTAPSILKIRTIPMKLRVHETVKSTQKLQIMQTLLSSILKNNPGHSCPFHVKLNFGQTVPFWTNSNWNF